MLSHLGKVLKVALVAVALLACTAPPAQAWWYGGWGGWCGYGGYGYGGYGYSAYYPGYFGGYSYGHYPGYYGGYSYGYYPGYYRGYSYGYRPYYYGYSYPYSYYGYGRSYVSTPDTAVTRTSAYRAPDGGTVSNASYGERTNDRRAHLRVEVPADAKVWLDGVAMKSRGKVRDFYSPVLKNGKKYKYEVRARWKENGKTVDETKTVHVRANDWSKIDFTKVDFTR
jgi:uncharacterized protein (TIGR03000 family)